MAWASFCATSSMAASRACPSVLSSDVMGAWAALLVATTTKESLVEVSPSIVTRLNDRSARWRASCCTTDASTQASVAKKPSMVAMLGRIMPAPLLMPVMDTVAPPTWAWALNALGKVSVVMMPSAARAQWSACASANAAGRPASMRSVGRDSMITPVEKGNTCSGATFSKPARAWQVERARAKPSAPVPALALPVLMTIARTPLPAARCSRLTCTGAAQKRFCVKTPATLAPSSSKNTVRSLRLALRTPASVTPIRTPAMGCRSAATGARRFTGIECSFKKTANDYAQRRGYK